MTNNNMCEKQATPEELRHSKLIKDICDVVNSCVVKEDKFRLAVQISHGKIVNDMVDFVRKSKRQAQIECLEDMIKDFGLLGLMAYPEIKDYIYQKLAELKGGQK